MGLDFASKLVELARRRLPRWADRIFLDEALTWEPPSRFDFVRTETLLRRGGAPAAARRAAARAGCRTRRKGDRLQLRQPSQGAIDAAGGGAAALLGV